MKNNCSSYRWALVVLILGACSSPEPAVEPAEKMAPKKALEVKQTEAQVAPPATATAPARPTPPAPPAGMPPELAKKCAAFFPPWGEGNWIEWGQANPEAGEAWYDTIEEKMQQVDLTALPRCTHLTNVFLGFSSAVDLKPVAGMTWLKRLDLRFIEKLTDLAPLAGLKQLEYLNITGTGVGDLSPLMELPALRELEARMIPLTDLGPAAQMVALERIDLLKAPVKDLTPLARAPRLNQVLVCTTKVADLTPLFPVAERIRSLDLCASELRDFEQLRHFNKLTFLRLAGLPLNDLSLLGGMTEMEDLDLSQMPFKDLSPLQGMKKLKLLTILEVELDPGQIPALKKAIPGVEVVDKLQVE